MGTGVEVGGWGVKGGRGWGAGGLKLSVQQENDKTTGQKPDYSLFYLYNNFTENPASKAPTHCCTSSWGSFVWGWLVLMALWAFVSAVFRVL